MKTLVIGSGAREHAIATSFYAEGHEVICLPGNAGAETFAKPTNGSFSNNQSFANCAEKNRIDLTVVGPETYLENGIVDEFTKRGLTIFGPTKKATRLESSKVWAKEFMAKYEIPTAPFYICENVMDALTLLPTCIKEWEGVVIKPDGLTGGKGVMICHTLDSAKMALHRIMDKKDFGGAGNRVILEKVLKGKEISLLCLFDEKTCLPMIPAQDHKRLNTGDTGPNTGGMGAYAPVPFVTKETLKSIEQKIIEKTQVGLISEDLSYTGVLYFGLILTEEGPKVLEYNCRFGDPEALVILPLIKTDLAQTLLACCQNRLSHQTLLWKDKAACSVVLVSHGYPGKYEVGHEISGLDEIKNIANLYCFHAGTRRNQEGKILTNGGRVLGVTAIAKDLEEAAILANQAADKVRFPGVYYRKDIGHQALKNTMRTSYL